MDFKPPVAPIFQVNPGEPGEREDGWLNAAVDFLGEYHKDRNPNGWLNYNDDDDATGVGGYTVQLRFSSTTPELSMAPVRPLLMPSLQRPRRRTRHA